MDEASSHQKDIGANRFSRGTDSLFLLSGREPSRFDFHGPKALPHISGDFLT